MNRISCIRKISPGDMFTHYKKFHCKVMSLSEHTETHELLVIYNYIHEPNVSLACPIEVFNDYVNFNGVTKLRFEPFYETHLYYASTQ